MAGVATVAAAVAVADDGGDGSGSNDGGSFFRGRSRNFFDVLRERLSSWRTGIWRLLITIGSVGEMALSKEKKSWHSQGEWMAKDKVKDTGLRTK